MKGIEGDTGANLDIDSDKDPAKVKISGTKESIAKAKMAVMRIVEPPCVSFSCPRRLIPRLIGAKGAKIIELQEAYGLRIQVEQVDIASPPRGGSEDSRRISTLTTRILNDTIASETEDVAAQAENVPMLENGDSEDTCNPDPL